MYDQAEQHARFQHFLSICCGAMALFTVLLIGAYLYLGRSVLLIGGILCLISSIGFISINVIQRRRFSLAVAACCALLLALTFTATLLNPAFGLLNLLLPLIVAVLGLQYIHSRNIRWLLVGCWAAMIGVVLLSLYLPAPSGISRGVFTAISVGSVSTTAGTILLLLYQFSQRQTAIIRQLQVANHDLHQTRSSLELQVLERTAALNEALANVQEQSQQQAELLEQLARQQVVIRDLAVPVIPINRTTLVMPLVGAFDAERLESVQQQALQAIERQRARTLILDITGVPVVDTHIAQGVIMVVQATRLLGAEAVLVGIRPEVAQTMIGLGIELPGLRTFSELQAALQA